MRGLMALLVIGLGASTSLGAQVVHSAGIGRSLSTVKSQSTVALGELSRRESSRSTARGSVWKWVGIGALVGAVAGGALAANQVAHSNDPMNVGIFTEASVAVGAVVGGLGGAIAHAAIRRAPLTMSPNDR